MAVTWLILSGCSPSPSAVRKSSPDGEPTFAGTIGPLLHRECAPCHRPRGPAPFPLIDFRDAARRAGQIAEVTGSGYMPPWLPSADGEPLTGARRLTGDEVAVLEAWAAAGAPAGDLSALAPPELPGTGWDLGPPDLLVRMAEPYELAPSGSDEYRNFVLPVELDAPRWIAAVELRPGNPRAVHHARMLVDATPASSRLDATEAGPGFTGMIAGTARSPDGFLVGWTPGKRTHPPEPGLAFRLEPGHDIVLQLHMVRTGKAEPVQASAGLYFAAGPPVRPAVALVLGSRDIDLPPGASRHPIEASYRLPVDVEALAIYPHAHYLGREMHVTAGLPGGGSRTLLHIPQWDFDWQDEYRFAVPVELPAGTELTMRYTYDNSASNPRNPSDPPRRVGYGPRSTDEMAELLIQVVPREPRDAARLEADFERWRVLDAIAYRQRMATAHPGDPAHPAAIGASWLHLGRADRAVEPLERALELAPGDVVTRNNLGYALAHTGRPGRAAEELRRALALRPDHLEARFNLAQALRAAGREDEALAEYRRLVAADGRLAGPLHGAASILVGRARPGSEELAEALEFAERAVRLTRGQNAEVLETLARAHAVAGRWAEAATTLREALEVAAPERAAELEARLAGYRRRDQNSVSAEPD